MLLKEANLSLEVLILSIGGMALLITGILLFPVSVGTLPYYENGLYGLLLIVIALQVIALGKTPVGEMRRSKLTLGLGVSIAVVGILTCFIPVLNRLPRVLLFLCLGPGGLVLLLRMGLSRDKLRTWLKYGGIFRHLIFSCSGVYVLSMLMAFLLWQRSLVPTPLAAVATLFFSAAIFYLAWVLQKIYRQYPEAEQRSRGAVALSTDQALLLLMGVFMLLLGVLILPVSMGRLPFSASAQIGLLMVIFAVQMLASGSTPIGPFPRSWLVIAVGLVFAALGIVSCIVPGILVSPLTVVVGVLNILGGLIALAKLRLLRRAQAGEPRRRVPPILARLSALQVTMNLLAILFGTSMLMPGVIRGEVIGVILAANGCVLLCLLYILVRVERMRGNVESAT